MKHQSRLQINLNSYQNNLAWFRSKLPSSVEQCAVVKADAYGHGLRLIAPAAAACGVERFGIVDNWEAAAIRECGLPQRIIRLRPSTADEAAEASQWSVEESVGSLGQAKAISDLNLSIPVHVKIDTGIGRMGFPFPPSENDFRHACRLPGLRVVGVMTHFPCADEDNPSITEAQFHHFEASLDRIRDVLPGDVDVHVSNSPASQRFSEIAAKTTFVRLGISSYGLAPSPDMKLPVELKPVMQWKTHITLVRDMPAGATIGYGMTHTLSRDSRIATLPLGYADGYLRAFSNRAAVLVHGTRAQVVGRVSMDMVTVDVTDIDNVCIGDEVILLGTQQGESILMEELSGYASTIDYELACIMGKCNAPWREVM